MLRQLYGEVKQVKQGIMVLKQGIKNEIEANRSEICDVVEVRIQELMMKVMGQRNRKEEGRMVVRVN